MVRAVIRLYGARLIGMLLQSGGRHFDHQTNAACAEVWTVDMCVLEGWGGEDGTPHGWCGIRALSAEVVVPGFDGVELHEVKAA